MRGFVDLWQDDVGEWGEEDPGAFTLKNSVEELTLRTWAEGDVVLSWNSDKIELYTDSECQNKVAEDEGSVAGSRRATVAPVETGCDICEAQFRKFKRVPGGNMFCGKKKFWRRLGLGLVAGGAIASVSCRQPEPRGRRPIDYVPSEADIIAVVDYRGFLRNKILRTVLDVSDVERTLAAIGISPGDILRIAGFAKISPAMLVPPGEARSGRDTGGDFSVIVQGKGGFDPVFKALSEEGWIEQEHEGKTYWANEKQNMAAASIRRDILAAGTPAAVQKVIDVAVGKASGAMDVAANSASGDILRRIGTRSEISLAISFSREMKMAAMEASRSMGVFRGMTGARIFGSLFDVLGRGRGFGLSFAGVENGIAARVIFVAGDVASAKAIAGLVTVAKILIPRIGDFGPMKEAAEAVQGLNVSSERNLVLISFRIPETIVGAGARRAGSR